SITGGYQTLGRGILSSTAVANRKGYAGYEYDPTFEGAGRHLYHVRHRVYDAELGRWTRRDPVGYVEGMGLYQYTHSRPTRFVDPFGLGGMCINNCIQPIDIIPETPPYVRMPLPPGMQAPCDGMYLSI